jgi:Zn-dependent protease with chaperone function
VAADLGAGVALSRAGGGAARAAAADPGRRAALRALAALAGGAALAAADAGAAGPASAPPGSSEEALEARAAAIYRARIDEARARGVLAPADDPQRLRVAAIARRLEAFAPAWNPRAAGWRWEVELVRSDEVNADCLPGGKIVVQSGLLARLAPSDDELAMVIGHEMGHALREHARARLGEQRATSWLIALAAQVFGWGGVGRSVAGAGGNLLALKFSRDEETEADLVGLELAARAGYDPEAAVTLWRKIGALAAGGPPALLSDHPSSPQRLQVLARNVARVRRLRLEAPRPGAGTAAPASSVPLR